ncbi:MAG: NosD domain-containing protein, partial [Candidatus Thorarchaeota archaeon]
MRDNQVFDCESGLRLISWDYPPLSANSVISNNYITNCQVGIGVDGLSEVLVEHNIIESCWDGLTLGGGSNILADNNTLSDIENIGITVYNLFGSTIAHNDVSVGLIGIRVGHSTDNQFADNHLVGGGFIFETYETDAGMLHHEMSGNTLNGFPVGYFWEISDTTIDGSLYGQVILASCSNVTLENGVFSGVGSAIPIWYSQKCTIRNVQVIDNFLGIEIRFSDEITIEDSVISNNIFGISFSETDYCTISRCDFQNNFIGALTNVYVNYLTVEDSNFVDHFGGLSLRATTGAVIQNNSFENGSIFIDFEMSYYGYWQHTFVGNTVNGKPLGYFNGESDLSITASDYGQLILVRCQRISITGGTISEVTAGIQIGTSNDFSISDVHFSNMAYGVIVSMSDRCNITDSSFNHITKKGIHLDRNDHIVSGIEAYNYEWVESPSMYISNFPETSLLWGSPFFIESSWDSNNIKIQDSTIEDAEYGVFLQGQNHLVYNNTLRNCRNGIYVFTADVFDNKFYNVMYGITTSWENCRIYGNLIRGGYMGIVTQTSENATIFGNTIEDARYGLYLQSTDAYVYNNVFSNTTIRVRGYSPEDYRHIFENNYIDGGLFGYFFNITDMSLDSSAYGAIMLAYCKNVTVENGIFTGSQIYLERSSHCKIVNVTMSNYRSSALILSYSDNCQVLDNILVNNGRGVYLYVSTNTLVSGNTILESEYQGVYCYYSRESIISNNVVSDSGDIGILVDYGSDRFVISNNKLERNVYTAIDVNVDSYPNYYGIQVGEITGNNVTGNIGTGINIGPNVTNITIHSNAIISNEGGNARDDGMYNQWDNGVNTGNGWDDYSGAGYYFIPGTAGSVDRFPERIGGLTPPSLSSPSDLTYEFGSFGYSLEWSVVAEYSVNYELLIDGSPMYSGSWTPGDDPISADVDNLEVGDHEVI